MPKPHASDSHADELERAIRNGSTSEVLDGLLECECERRVMMALSALTEGTLSVVSADPKSACAAVKALMDKPFLQRSKLMQQCCQLLRSVAYTDSNKYVLAKEGGLQAVVLGMNLHRDDIQVQIAGALTLRTLASSAEIREVIVEEHAIGTVVRAMSSHLRNASLQVAGCKLLHVLCFDDVTKPKILHASGVLATTEALLAFPRDREIRASVCAILYFMVFEIESIVSNNPESDIGRKVVKAAMVVLAEKEDTDNIPHAMAVLAAVLSSTNVFLPLYAAKSKVVEACLDVLASTEDDELILDTTNAVHAVMRNDEALEFFVEACGMDGLRNVAKAAKQVLARTDDRDAKVYCEGLISVVNEKRSSTELTISKSKEKEKSKPQPSEELKIRNESPEVPDLCIASTVGTDTADVEVCKEKEKSRPQPSEEPKFRNESPEVPDLCIASTVGTDTADVEVCKEKEKSRPQPSEEPKIRNESPEVPDLCITSTEGTDTADPEVCSTREERPGSPPRIRPKGFKARAEAIEVVSKGSNNQVEPDALRNTELLDLKQELIESEQKCRSLQDSMHRFREEQKQEQSKLKALSKVLLQRDASKSSELMAYGFIALLRTYARSSEGTAKLKSEEVAELQSTIQTHTSQRAALEVQLTSLRMDKQHSDGALNELSKAVTFSKELQAKIRSLESQLREAASREDVLVLEQERDRHERSVVILEAKLRETVPRDAFEKIEQERDRLQQSVRLLETQLEQAVPRSELARIEEERARLEQSAKLHDTTIEANQRLQAELEECKGVLAALRSESLYHQERYEKLQMEGPAQGRSRRYEHEAMQKLVEELKSAKQALARASSERDAEVEAVKTRLEAEHRVVIKAMSASRNRLEAKLETSSRESFGNFSSPSMQRATLSNVDIDPAAGMEALLSPTESTEHLPTHVTSAVAGIFRRLQDLNDCASGLSKVCVRRFAKKAEMFASPLMMAKLDLLMDKSSKKNKSKTVSFDAFVEILDFLGANLVRKGKLTKPEYPSAFPGLHALFNENGIAYSPLKRYNERPSPVPDDHELIHTGNNNHEVSAEGGEDEIYRIWKREEIPLRAIFNYYAETYRSSKCELSKLDGTQMFALQSSMAIHAFCRMCLDFDIIPSLLNHAKVSRLFNEEQSCQEGRQHRISYSAWLRLLTRIACLKFGSKDVNGGRSVPVRILGLLHWMDASGGKGKMRHARNGTMVRKFKVGLPVSS